MRKPYAGYIVKLANSLSRLSAAVPDVAGYLAQNPDWMGFCGGLLAEENARNETALGGRRATTEGEDCGAAKEAEEQHLIFEGSLAAVFRKLKDVTFEEPEQERGPEEEPEQNSAEVVEEEKPEAGTETKADPTPAESKMPEAKKEEPAKAAEAETPAALAAEKKENDCGKYTDSQYWQNGFIYTLESINADYV